MTTILESLDRTLEAARVPIHTRAPLIDVVNISQRTEDGTTILHGINFVVRPGEVVAIAGGSGEDTSPLSVHLRRRSPISGGTIWR